MKKYLLLIPILFCIKAYAKAPQDGEVSKSVAAPKEYSSNAVYQSSTTCAGSTLQAVFISSPFPAALFAIDITSPNGGATVEVFDGAASTANARRVAYPMNASTGRAYNFNVSFSSWLAVSNQNVVGGNPACINILYRVR